jgi:hypothetical protein
MVMTSGKGKFSILNKVAFLAILVTGLALMPVISFAQDLPCGGDDPYESCPLDTYVWIMAFAALIAGAVIIYKQQKKRAGV